MGVRLRLCDGNSGLLLLLWSLLTSFLVPVVDDNDDGDFSAAYDGGDDVEDDVEDVEDEDASSGPEHQNDEGCVDTVAASEHPMREYRAFGSSRRESSFGGSTRIYLVGKWPRWRDGVMDS